MKKSLLTICIITTSLFANDELLKEVLKKAAHSSGEKKPGLVSFEAPRAPKRKHSPTQILKPEREAALLALQKYFQEIAPNAQER